MTWEVLAQGSPEEFELNPPAIELAKGTRIRLEMDTSPFPVAPLANLWGAEWVYDKLFNEAGAAILDVRSDGWYTIIVDMEADPVWVPLLIAVILAIVIAYGIHELKLMAEIGIPSPISNIATIVKWSAIGVVGVLGIKLVSDLVKAGGKT